MQFLLIVVALLAGFPQTLRPPASGRSEPVLVKAVINGSTISVQSVGRVRLLGIIAPEISRAPATSAPFAQEAKARLTSLLLNRWVRLEQDMKGTGIYNPRVAYVMTEDGQFVNAVLVREGLARVSSRAQLSRLEELRRAEREAQQTRRGIWGGLPQIPATSYTSPANRPR